jgi:hypothetical protein
MGIGERGLGEYIHPRGWGIKRVRNRIIEFNFFHTFMKRLPLLPCCQLIERAQKELHISFSLSNELSVSNKVC